MKLVARDVTQRFHQFFGDEYGPELVVGVFDRDTEEFHGGFVGDNTSLCNPRDRKWNGGIRYEQNSDILRLPWLEQLDLLFKHLARPMTLKHIFCYPLGSMPPGGFWGGGKFKVVQGGSVDRTEVITEWTQALWNFKLKDGRRLLGEAAIGGADAGITEDDLRLICEVTGDNKCVTGGPGYIKYETLGTTGLVLVHAAKILAEYSKTPWKGALVSISGLGQVGKGIIQALMRPEYHGPVVISVSNKEGAVRNHCGIDLTELLEAVKDHESGINSLVSQGRARAISLGTEMYDSVRFLFLALSKEGVLDRGNSRRVAAPFILSGTNSGITRDGYRELYSRTRIAPADFMVNIGAASTAKSSWHGIPVDKCIELALCAAKTNLLWVLEEAKQKKKNLYEVALAEAEQRLKPLPETTGYGSRHKMS